MGRLLGSLARRGGWAGPRLWPGAARRFCSYVPGAGTAAAEKFFWEMLSTNTAREAARLVLRAQPRRADELRFALFHLNTFATEGAGEAGELRGVVDWLTRKEHLLALCSSNEEFLFTVTALHKLQRGCDADLAALRQFVVEGESLVCFEAFAPRDLVSLAAALVGLFAGAGGLRDVVGRVARAARVGAGLFAADELVLLAQVLAGAAREEPELGRALAEQWEALQSADRAQWMALLCAVYRLGFFEERLFSQGIQFALGEAPPAGGLLPEYQGLLQICVERFPSDLPTITRLYAHLLDGLQGLGEEEVAGLWALTAQLSQRNSAFNFEAVFEALKRVCLRAQRLSLARVSPGHCLAILQALAVLRVKDVAFVQLVLDCTLKRLKQMSNAELVTFFRVFYAFSRMFEVYYLQIHEELLARLGALDLNQLHSLRDILVLKRRLFEGSPLLVVLGLQGAA